MKQKNIIRTVFSVTGLILLSKLLGFVKQMVTAAAFGTTLETDLIALSQGAINDIQYLLVQAVLSALIAVYLHTAQEGEDASRRFAFDVWKALTLITIGVIFAVELLSPLLAKLLAPAYSPEQLTQLSGYLRLFAPALLLLIWISIFNGLLHANKHFIPGEMISVHQSIILIAMAAVLSRAWGIQVLVVSFFVYNLWNVVYTAVLSRRYWCVSLGNPFANPAVRQLLKMMLPLLLGYSLVYVNQIVDKILVSGLDTGTVTALNYAAVLSNLIGTFISTFASMLFTYVTMRIASGDTAGAARLTEWTALLLSVLFLPISIITVLQAKEIVTVVYARGAFGSESVGLCAKALQGYALMFFPVVLREVYSRFQYGYQDSKRPMVNSSIGIVLNIVLSVALCPLCGVLGVAFATSMSVTLCGILNMWSAGKLNTALTGKPLLMALPWMLLGSAMCAAAGYWCGGVLSQTGALLRFMATTLLGMAAYTVGVSPVLLRLWQQRNITGKI